MTKPFFGVVHLPPLPHAAGSTGPDIECILAAARRDAGALAAGGADGIVIENFHDAPFHKGDRADPVPPDVPAVMAVVAHELRASPGLPLAVNVLRNDGRAALAVAAAADADFVRINVLAGAFHTDQGIVEGEAARTLAYRKRLGTSTRILADLMVKHATPLAAVDPAAAARDLAERAGAWGLVLSGDRTGEPVERAFLEEITAAVPDTPVWIGSGLDADNAGELWPRCHGAIVGTALKEGGAVDAPVDPDRVRALRRALDAAAG